jgi:hypothetical protein
MVAKPGGEEAQAQADKCLAQASGPPAQQAALGGSHEQAMVPVSSQPGPTSRPVEEWVWPDPSNPGEAQFILCDEWEVKLWDLLE